MSLLDARAPHIMEVQLREVQATGSRGASELIPVGDPIVVRGSMQPVREWSTAEEYPYKGMQVLDLWRAYARTWPGNMDSLVYFQGEKYESVGNPSRRGMSRFTAHTVVTLKWLGKDDRPDAETKPSYNSPGHFYPGTYR